MLKKLTLTYFSLLFCVIYSANAQESKLVITTQTAVNKNVSFQYQKPDPGTYTVLIKFNTLTNANFGSLEQDFSVKNYSGTVLTLNPTNKDQGIGFSYTYNYLRGKLKPKFDANFVYLLPYKPGKAIRVAESGFVGSTYFGNTTPEDWKVYRFYTKTEDTITAVRKGVVVSVKDLYEDEMANGVAYTSKTNEVMIEHNDGTLATYRGLKKGIIVKVGESVYPGTAIGLNSKIGNSFAISLMLTYLKSKDIADRSSQTLANSKSLYGFITPHFYTKEDVNVILEPNKTYTSNTAQEVIQKEFSKKELKQALQ